jgi:hypothetical protein
MSFFVSESIKDAIDENEYFGELKNDNNLNWAVLNCLHDDNAIQLKIIHFKFVGKELTIIVESNLNNFELIYFKSIKPESILFKSKSIKINSDLALKSALYNKDIDAYLIELSYFY